MSQGKMCVGGAMFGVKQYRIPTQAYVKGGHNKAAGELGNPFSKIIVGS